MDQRYKEIHQKAEFIRNKVFDYIDDRSHEQGEALCKQVHDLLAVIKIKLGPRSLEDKTKQIIKHLEEMRRDGDKVMDYEHIDYFRKEYEALCLDLRKFENY